MGKGRLEQIAAVYGKADEKACSERERVTRELVRKVADAYPGQNVKQSWRTMESMLEAISNGNADGYNTARAADPDGNLALIVAERCAEDPIRSSREKKIKTLMGYESSYGRL